MTKTFKVLTSCLLLVALVASQDQSHAHKGIYIIYFIITINFSFCKLFSQVLNLFPLNRAQTLPLNPTDGTGMDKNVKDVPAMNVPATLISDVIPAEMALSD